MQPGPLVTMQFTGDPLPKDKIDELVPVEREGSVDQDLLEDSARRITDYLNQQGYWKAEVKPPERGAKPTGQLTLVFNVKRGSVYRVAPGGVEVSRATSRSPGSRSAAVDPDCRQGELFIALDAGRDRGRDRADLPDARVRDRGSRDPPSTKSATDWSSRSSSIKEGPRVVIGERRRHRQHGDPDRSAARRC